MQDLICALVQPLKSLGCFQALLHLLILQYFFTQLQNLIFHFTKLCLRNLRSNAGIFFVIIFLQMTENVIIIRITVGCHTISGGTEFFLCLTFGNSSEITAQALVHIWFFCMNSLIDRIVMNFWLGLHNCGRI